MKVRKERLSETKSQLNPGIKPGLFGKKAFPPPLASPPRPKLNKEVYTFGLWRGLRRRCEIRGRPRLPLEPHLVCVPNQALGIERQVGPDVRPYLQVSHVDVVLKNKIP